MSLGESEGQRWSGRVLGLLSAGLVLAVVGSAVYLRDFPAVMPVLMVAASALTFGAACLALYRGEVRYRKTSGSGMSQVVIAEYTFNKVWTRAIGVLWLTPLPVTCAAWAWEVFGPAGAVGPGPTLVAFGCTVVGASVLTWLIRLFAGRKVYDMRDVLPPLWSAPLPHEEEPPPAGECPICRSPLADDARTCPECRNRVR